MNEPAVGSPCRETVESSAGNHERASEARFSRVNVRYLPGSVGSSGLSDLPAARLGGDSKL